MFVSSERFRPMASPSLDSSDVKADIAIVRKRLCSQV